MQWEVQFEYKIHECTNNTKKPIEFWIRRVYELEFWNFQSFHCRRVPHIVLSLAVRFCLLHSFQIKYRQHTAQRTEIANFLFIQFSLHHCLQISNVCCTIQTDIRGVRCWRNWELKCVCCRLLKLKMKNILLKYFHIFYRKAPWEHKTHKTANLKFSSIIQVQMKNLHRRIEIHYSKLTQWKEKSWKNWKLKILTTFFDFLWFFVGVMGMI